MRQTADHTDAIPLCVDRYEAAAMMRMSVRHFLKLVKAGKVKKLTHLGERLVRYSVDQLRALVNQSEAQP